MNSAASVRLRNLQAEYFALFDDVLGDDVREAAMVPDAELLGFVSRRFAQSSIVCPYHGVSLSSLEYRVANFTKSITQFWKERESAVVESIRSLQGSRVQFPYCEYGPTMFRDVKKLAAYFDTAIVLDAMYPWTDDMDLRDGFERSALVTNFRRAAMLYRLKRMALIADPPMLLVLPSIGATDDAKVNDYVLSFLDRIIPGKFDSYSRAVDVVMQLSNRQSEQLLEEAERSALYQRALADFDLTPLSRTAYSLKSRKARPVVCYLRDLPPEIRLKTFVTQLWGWFDTYCEYQAGASILGNDVIVGRRMWELHKWHLERTARNNFAPANFSEEELSALALLEPSVGFLGDISIEELLLLRSADGLEDIRKQLRIERSYLKTMSVDEFPSKAKCAARGLLDAVVQFETAMQEEVGKLKSRKCRAFAGLGLALTLGVASIAMPELAIPATAVGLLAGTESIRSVLNEHLAGRKKHKEILSRPIGLLYQVYSRGNKAQSER